jgi:DNA-binding FadR family transcriptional regulator
MRLEGLATEAGQAADRRFHDTMLRASGNEALAALSSTVGAAVQWTTRFKQRAHATPRDPLPEHLAVFDAIVASDGPAAAAAMRNLVDLAHADMAAGPMHRP